MASSIRSLVKSGGSRPSTADAMMQARVMSSARQYGRKNAPTRVQFTGLRICGRSGLNLLDHIIRPAGPPIDIVVLLLAVGVRSVAWLNSTSFELAAGQARSGG